MTRPLVVLRLLVTFVVQVVTSGATTAWLIVRPGRAPRPGLVRITFCGIDPAGAALLGWLIALTPGTTPIDVDVARGEVLLHLLDASDPARTARAIRRGFEEPIRRLFPAGGRR